MTFKINGVDITPYMRFEGLKYTTFDLDSDEAGRTLDGKNIIAILENALITSGLETEGKTKESAVGTYTFECHAAADADSFDTLPWKIYYPKASV